MLTMATMADKESLKALWKLCFDESDEFLNWFFDNRFIPEYCPVFREDGRIAACLHALPARIRLRNRVLPCAVVAGVATHPDYRGRGLMNKVLGYFMARMREEGIPLVSHRPAHLEVYRSAGHFPACDARYVELPAQAPRPGADDCAQWDVPSSYGALFRCYATYARQYSGMLDRSYADFVLKCQDYLSCGAQCIAALDGQGGVEGYCIYFDQGYDAQNTLMGEECAALSPGAYARLYAALARRSEGRPLKLRMAPNAGLAPDGAIVSVIPRSVLGVADVSALLAATGLPNSGVIEVIDPMLPANRGLYTLAGEPAQGQAQLRISAGRLAQWAVGYRSMAQIVRLDQAAAPDPSIVERMDALGTCPCFVVDEY